MKLIERCYIFANEREYFKKLRSDETKLGDDKVKLARKQYRGQGLYIDEILDLLNEEYGVSSYGSVKYTRNEMYWIGYVYRYFALDYDFSSSQIYRIVKPQELRNVFLPYHTMDPAQAIERILEAKGLSFEQDEAQELKRQYEIYKRIRQA